MHKNILAYWRHLENLGEGHADRPRPRVCRLMLDMFERWRLPQAFPEFDGLGGIVDHQAPYDPADVMGAPLAVRRGLALRKTLALLAGDWGALVPHE